MSRPFRSALLALTLALATTGSVSAQSQPGVSISERIAAGTPFMVATLPGAVPLRSGAWSYPGGGDRWTVFEGRYNPESGIWATDAVGFQVRGIEYHSCPPDLDHSRFRCGGVHTDGHRLDRRVTPHDHVLIVLENELTFDEAGMVYRDGTLIGMVSTPPSPY